MWKSVVLMVVAAMALAGCNRGPVLVKAKGQVLKEGKAFVPEEGQVLQIVFTPISPNNEPARNLYVAEVNQKTGAFYAAGAQKQGVPPGKYRASVELKKKKKDLFNEKYNLVDSPFVFEIGVNSAPLIIELDSGDAPQQAATGTARN